MRPTYRFVLLATAAAVILVASAAQAAERECVGAPPDETVSAQAPVAVTLTTDRVVYLPGQPVRMTLTLRNMGTTPVTLRFANSQTYDLRIRHVPSGAVVWQWSWHRVFLQVLLEQTLLPGETREVIAVWMPQVPPSCYRVEAVVTSYDPGPFASNPRWVQIGR
jgi:Intracellular proteinase inhibitor